MEESNQDEVDRELEHYLDETFPGNRKFSICIFETAGDYRQRLDTVLLHDTYKICVKNNYYCHNWHPIPSNIKIKYVYMDFDKPTDVTYRTVLNAMINMDYDPLCEHSFLEMISVVNDATLDLAFGS